MINEVLAIIPARGGSKGIPRKNLLMLGGQPLLAHTIRMTRQAMHVTRVMVSTDDAEIAQTALAHGAEVVWRPAELSGDTASSEAALLQVLDHLQSEEDYKCDLVVMVQCTSPFTRAEDLDGAIEAIILEGADTAFAATPCHHFLWRLGKDKAEAVNHDASRRQMRQERVPEFVETGAFYAMRTEGFREARHRFFGKTILFETPPSTHFELDEKSDVVIAEERFRSSKREAAYSMLPLKIEAIVFDFDGVMTDDRVFTDQNGKETVACSRSDGMGVEMLRRAGIPMLVLSKEQNPAVAARCRKLQLPVQHDVQNKPPAFTSWMKAEQLDAASVIYVGNDINDVDCLRLAGCGVVPRDAHPDALAIADLVLDADGGRGAVRQLADLILGGR